MVARWLPDSQSRFRVNLKTLRTVALILLASAALAAPKPKDELSQAHFLMLQGNFLKAEKAYAVWLERHPKSNYAEAARYWRGVCLKELGKSREATAVLEPLRRDGRQDLWRGLAGLLLASIKAGQEGRDPAYREYARLADAAWAQDVRPQALLGAAQMTSNAWKRKTLLKTLNKEYPESEEAAKARKLLKEPKRATTRFGVQVGAFVKTSGALAEQKRFAKAGNRVTVVKRKQIGLVLHAVIIGPYDTRKQAARKTRQLKAQGHPNVFVTTY